MRDQKYSEAKKEYEKALSIRKNFSKRGLCRQINCLMGLADAQLSSGCKQEAMQTYRAIYERQDNPMEGSIYYEIEEDERYDLAQFQVFIMVLLDSPTEAYAEHQKLLACAQLKRWLLEFIDTADGRREKIDLLLKLSNCFRNSDRNKSKYYLE